MMHLSLCLLVERASEWASDEKSVLYCTVTNDQTSPLKRTQSRETAPSPPQAPPALHSARLLVDYNVTVGYWSLLGLFLVAGDFLFDGELAALDGHQDVGVLRRRGHELRDDKLSVLTSAHAQWLEALQTVHIVNLELLEGESGVLDKITEEGGVLDWLDNLFTFREVLDGDA